MSKIKRKVWGQIEDGKEAEELTWRRKNNV